MSSIGLRFSQLDSGCFGVVLTVDGGSIEQAVGYLLAAAEMVLDRFHRAGGLMVVRGLDGLAGRPDLLVRLSHVFGPEVENVPQTLTSPRFFHPSVPEIMVLSNKPPCGHPPPPKSSASRDDPEPDRYPAQPNWHTDQSYRRPPPDVSLLYGVETPGGDQGRTLYADCAAAHDALDPETKARIASLEGVHAAGWVGRTPADVRAGVAPKPLLAHQTPQRQPLVRVHPVTGRRALYVCEERQMDFVDGPIDGLEPGPGGAGAELLRRLLRHATHPDFTYAHHWREGDLVIGDNRSLLHAATWYDAERFPRVMWRTTVMGNPGAEYAGEAKSWIPADGLGVMEGMEDA